MSGGTAGRSRAALSAERDEHNARVEELRKLVHGAEMIAKFLRWVAPRVEADPATEATEE